MATVTELLTTFHKVLECPVCLETIKVPFKQCVRGHLMCSDCVKTLTACPSCQGDLCIENPIGVKSLLEAMPHFCRFSDKGCTLVVEQGNDHEVFCGFRPVACRDVRCQVVVPVCEILKHYESDHPQRSIFKQLNQSAVWAHFKPQSNCIYNVPVHLFEHFFWVVLNNDVEEKQLKINFLATPNGKLFNDYFVRVTFAKEDDIYTNTIKASIISSIKCGEKEEVIKDGEKKCDETRDNNASENADDLNGEVIRIPQRALSLFMNKEEQLEFQLYFFWKKIK